MPSPSHESRQEVRAGYRVRLDDHASWILLLKLLDRCGKGGIGEALVQEYTRRGIFAVATVLPNENSDHLTAAGITWFPLDVTDDESVVSLKKEISSLTNGYFEFLVNNA